LADLGLAAKTRPVVGFLDRASVANVQGLGAIPVIRLERRLGRLPDQAMNDIKRALAFVLELNTSSG
jgi:mRNA interferase MazF